MDTPEPRILTIDTNAYQDVLQVTPEGLKNLQDSLLAVKNSNLSEKEKIEAYNKIFQGTFLRNYRVEKKNLQSDLINVEGYIRSSPPGIYPREYFCYEPVNLKKEDLIEIDTSKYDDSFTRPILEFCTK